jgi:hypothetical protein
MNETIQALLAAGEAHGLQRRSPAAQADQPMTNTTRTAPQPYSAWDNYVSGSLDGLSRIPRELTRNVGDLISRYGRTAAEVGAGMLPGAGMVEAPRNYQAGNEAFSQGRYLDAAGQYAMGVYNQATDMIPGTPTLAHGLVPAAAAGATAAERLQSLKGIYEPTTQLKPSKTLTWEDLEGKTLIATQGDRTMAGQRVLGTEQDGLFKTPVGVYGGRDYGRAEAGQQDAAGWASTASGAKPLNSKVQRLMEAGHDPVLAYMPLGPDSSDFTKQSWDAYEQLLRARGGEAAMPVIAKGMPFDPSIDAMREYMLGLTGTQRSAVFKDKFTTKGRVEASGVHPAEVRQLIRDPGLQNANTGDIGYGFIKPTGTITDTPNFVHPDYSHQLGGEHLGQFAPGMIAPRSLVFRDHFAANPLQRQMDVTKQDHAFKTQLPIQKVTPQMVDELMMLQRLYEAQ